MNLDQHLSRVERHALLLEGVLRRQRHSTGRNMRSTQATLDMHYQEGRRHFAAALAVATDADDQPGTRLDKVAVKWYRAERRFYANDHAAV